MKTSDIIIVFSVILITIGGTLVLVTPSIKTLQAQTAVLQEQNAALKYEVADLKQACRWADILRQLLPPQAQAELDVLEEVYRQNNGGP